MVKNKFLKKCLTTASVLAAMAGGAEMAVGIEVVTNGAGVYILDTAAGGASANLAGPGFFAVGDDLKVGVAFGGSSIANVTEIRSVLVENGFSLVGKDFTPGGNISIGAVKGGTGGGDPANGLFNIDLNNKAITLTGKVDALGGGAVVLNTYDANFSFSGANSKLIVNATNPGEIDLKGAAGGGAMAGGLLRATTDVKFHDVSWFNVGRRAAAANVGFQIADTKKATLEITPAIGANVAIPELQDDSVAFGGADATLRFHVDTSKGVQELRFGGDFKSNNGGDGIVEFKNTYAANLLTINDGGGGARTLGNTAFKSVNFTGGQIAVANSLVIDAAQDVKVTGGEVTMVAGAAGGRDVTVSGGVLKSGRAVARNLEVNGDGLFTKEAANVANVGGTTIINTTNVGTNEIGTAGNAVVVNRGKLTVVNINAQSVDASGGANVAEIAAAAGNVNNVTVSGSFSKITLTGGAAVTGAIDINNGGELITNGGGAVTGAVTVANDGEITGNVGIVTGVVTMTDASKIDGDVGNILAVGNALNMGGTAEITGKVGNLTGGNVLMAGQAKVGGAIGTVAGNVTMSGDSKVVGAIGVVTGNVVLSNNANVGGDIGNVTGNLTLTNGAYFGKVGEVTGVIGINTTSKNAMTIAKANNAGAVVITKGIVTVTDLNDKALTVGGAGAEVTLVAHDKNAGNVTVADNGLVTYKATNANALTLLNAGHIRLATDGKLVIDSSALAAAGVHAVDLSGNAITGGNAGAAAAGGHVTLTANVNNLRVDNGTFGVDAANRLKTYTANGGKDLQTNVAVFSDALNIDLAANRTFKAAINNGVAAGNVTTTITGGNNVLMLEGANNTFGTTTVTANGGAGLNIAAANGAVTLEAKFVAGDAGALDKIDATTQDFIIIGDAGGFKTTVIGAGKTFTMAPTENALSILKSGTSKVTSGVGAASEYIMTSKDLNAAGTLTVTLEEANFEYDNGGVFEVNAVANKAVTFVSSKDVTTGKSNNRTLGTAANPLTELKLTGADKIIMGLGVHAAKVSVNNTGAGKTVTLSDINSAGAIESSATNVATIELESGKADSFKFSNDHVLNVKATSLTKIEANAADQGTVNLLGQSDATAAEVVVGGIGLANAVKEVTIGSAGNHAKYLVDGVATKDGLKFNDSASAILRSKGDIKASAAEAVNFDGKAGKIIFTDDNNNVIGGTNGQSAIITGGANGKSFGTVVNNGKNLTIDGKTGDSTNNKGLVSLELSNNTNAVSVVELKTFADSQYNLVDIKTDKVTVLLTPTKAGDNNIRVKSITVDSAAVDSGVKFGGAAAGNNTVLLGSADDKINVNWGTAAVPLPFFNLNGKSVEFKAGVAGTTFNVYSNKFVNVAGADLKISSAGVYKFGDMDNANRLNSADFSGLVNTTDVVEIPDAFFSTGDVGVGKGTIKFGSDVDLGTAAAGAVSKIRPTVDNDGALVFNNSKAASFKGQIGEALFKFSTIKLDGKEALSFKDDVKHAKDFVFTADSTPEHVITFDKEAGDAGANIYNQADSVRTVKYSKSQTFSGVYGGKNATDSNSAGLVKLYMPKGETTKLANKDGFKNAILSGNGKIELDVADIALNAIGVSGDTPNNPDEVTFKKNATITNGVHTSGGKAVVEADITAKIGGLVDNGLSLKYDVTSKKEATAVLGGTAFTGVNTDEYNLKNITTDTNQKNKVSVDAKFVRIGDNVGSLTNVLGELELKNTDTTNPDTTVYLDSNLSANTKFADSTILVVNGDVGFVGGSASFADDAAIDLAEGSLVLSNGAVVNFSGDVATLRIKAVANNSESYDKDDSTSIKLVDAASTAATASTVDFRNLKKLEIIVKQDTAENFIPNTQRSLSYITAADLSKILNGNVEVTVSSENSAAGSLVRYEVDKAKAEFIQFNNAAAGLEASFQKQAVPFTATDSGVIQLIVSAKDGAAKQIFNLLPQLNVENQVKLIQKLSENNSENASEALEADTSSLLTASISNILGSRVGDLDAPAAFGAPIEVSDAGTSGVAAGSEHDRYGIWVAPFYSSADQKTRKGVSGYKAETAGATVGFDTKANDDLTVGAAVSLMNSRIKGKKVKSGDNTKADALYLSLYGSQRLVDNWFLRGIVGFGNNQIRNNEQRVSGNNTTETAKAKYSSTSFNGELQVGYNYVVSQLAVTPTVGMRYIRANDASYRESGTSFQNLDVSRKAKNSFEVLAGVRVDAMTFDVNGMKVTPEVHAGLAYDLIGKNPKVDVRIDGAAGLLPTKSAKPAKLFYNAGTGVNASYGMMDYGLTYNANMADKYVGHSGSLSMRVNF